MDTPYLMLLISLVIGVVGFLVKTQMQRIDVLEKEMTTKPSDEDVRRVLDDKIEPIKDSMTEIRNKVDKVIDMLLNNRN